MPGIAGIISRNPPAACIARLRRMLGAMMHENFYSSAAVSIPESGIYAGTVMFENSADGIFQDETGEIVLMFSGECFWDSKPASGEKLIQLYQQGGQRCFEKLNGLFSGLLIDKSEKRSLLFNDRYGVQRIYFHETGGDFYFASEAKALLRILPELREFHLEGIVDYFTFGCALDWRSIFYGVEVLPGGSSWIFENGRCHKKKYFQPELWESQPPLPADEFEDRLQQTFRRILPRYFGSGSKVGIALTGGLDTRMIMACRPRDDGQTTCYTFSGDTGETFDDKIAARVAAAAGLNHQLLRLGRDFFSNFADHADKAVYVTDGCAGICNAHEVYFNRRARDLAPTRLTGNFGSEVLRGFSTFKPLPLSLQLFSPDLREKITSNATTLSAHKNEPMTFSAFKEIPWNLFGNLAAGRSQLHFRTPYLDNELVELAYRAPETSRQSSLPSFRLIRAGNPALGEIPTDRGFGGKNSGLRFLSRRLFAETTFKLDYYSTAGLPKRLSAFNSVFMPIVNGLRIAGMHKFLRYSEWFRKALASRVRDVLSDPRVRNNGIWNPRFLDNLLAQHIAGRNDFSAEINAVLSLESVERQFLRELPDAIDL